MLKFIKTLIDIPTGQTKEVDAIETWIVHWKSRYGKYNGETKEQAQAFINYDDALKLKHVLDDANKLIGNTSETKVEIIRQKFV